jgi:cysteine-rich repeat protein
MTKNFSWLAIATGTMLAAGAIGCATDDELDTAESVPQIDSIKVKPSGVFVAPDFNLALAFRTKTGAKIDGNLFAAKGDVFVTTSAIEAGKTVRPMDWMFQVRNSDGTVISTDLARCRLFHVGTTGRIDSIASAVDAYGNACDHMTSKLATGEMLVNLLPFANVKTTAANRMVFTIAAAPKTKFFPEKAPLVGTFAVQLTTTDDDHTCTCGDGTVDDGEQCDDSNTSDGDGCSHDCMTE